MKKYRRIFISLFLFCSLYGCAILREAIQKPTVEFQDFSIADIDFTGVNTMFDFKVKNPNPVGVKINGFDYRFIIEGNQFLSGNNPQEVLLKSAGESTISIPIAIKYLDVYKAVAALKGNDNVPYQLAGDIYFNTPIGRLQVPFSKRGNLPALKMPKVSLGEVRLKALSLTKADIEFDINFHNPNAFGISLNNLNYNLALNRGQIAKGAVEYTELAQKANGTLHIPVTLNFIEIGRAAYSILTKKTVNYQFKGATKLITPWKEIDLPYLEEGSVDIQHITNAGR